MEQAKKYVDRFFKNSKKEIKRGHDMKTDVWREFVNNLKDTPFETTLLLFKYGYVKGYRACQSEQKKKI